MPLTPDAPPDLGHPKWVLFGSFITSFLLFFLSDYWVFWCNFFILFLTLFWALFLLFWIDFFSRSRGFFFQELSASFGLIQGYFFFDEGNEKVKITLSFLGFFERCTALFFTLRLHNFWVVFFSFFRLFLDWRWCIFIVIFDYFFADFLLLCVALFLKFAVTFFVFLFVFLDFCLVNIHAVYDCCACAAVQLNSDRCSFFFLFLGASLRFFCAILCQLNLFLLIVFVPFYGGFLPLLLARFFRIFIARNGGYLGGGYLGAFLACF